MSRRGGAVLVASRYHRLSGGGGTSEYARREALNITPNSGYKPSLSNAGLWNDSNVSMSTINGDVTFAATGETGRVVENAIINGKVTARGTNQILRNCWVRGPASPTANGGPLINSDTSTVSNFLVEDCLLEPQGDIYGWDGIAGHDYTLKRCLIRNTTDAFKVYNTAGGSAGASPANVTIYGTYVDRLAKYYPDGGGHADGTHNDGCQWESCFGNLHIYCTLFNGYISTEKGNTGGLNVANSGASISPAQTTINAILQINMNVSGGKTGGIIFEDNFVYGSNFGINATQAAIATALGSDSLGIFRRNKFDHGAYYPAGHASNATNTYTFNVSASINCTIPTTGADANVYEDTGAAVTVRRP